MMFDFDATKDRACARRGFAGKPNDQSLRLTWSRHSYSDRQGQTGWHWPTGLVVAFRSPGPMHGTLDNRFGDL